jgi:hypothetical protein
VIYKNTSSIEAVLRLESDLVRFILDLFPWVQEEWNPEQRGFIFILEEDVTEATRALPISPNIEGAVNIDLDTFNLWEGDAIFDTMSGHWNMVAVIGNDFDAYLFVSVALSPKLPNFYTYLKGR